MTSAAQKGRQRPPVRLSALDRNAKARIIAMGALPLPQDRKARGYGETLAQNDGSATLEAVLSSKAPAPDGERDAGAIRALGSIRE
jgi:hypothetical protein